MTDTLLAERRDDLLLLTLNRPEARNAVDPGMARALAAALDDFDADADLRVAILTGGGGTFCAGMDLKAFARGESIATRRGLLGATERPPAKPMIAAVEGWAVAGGCELALACDLIVAADDAHFGIPEVTRGIIAGAGGLRRLPLALPYHVAMELALTGEPLPARRAHELGMVNRLVTPGTALEAAIELARAIRGNAPLAVRTSKEILARAAGWDDPCFWEEQRATLDMIFASDDAHEGATAFAERRPPTWTGR